jgi:hypothetical protein
LIRGELQDRRGGGEISNKEVPKAGVGKWKLSTRESTMSTIEPGGGKK